MAEINAPLAVYKTKLSELNISDCIKKIMNTLPFRKLSEKTQVILSLSGPDVRTRLTHTIEVAKIARNISNALGLNADLAEAIALAHDIGHTPFGHVGERTLREIMCGCDTLDGKLEDENFDNSGFKHNLQSFRVLKDLEILPNGDNEAWPYILWGAMDHTSMSYSKPDSGMENEIFISCRHCDWVYSCCFHEKRECKRNIQNKRDEDDITKLVKHRLELQEGKHTEEEKPICSPWYCACLPVVKTKEDAKAYGIKSGGSSAELIQNKYIKKDYQIDIYCNQKCYMAKLWEYKISHESKLVSNYRFLFDHPFPNSFYAKYLYDYFYENNIINGGWISVESQIVKQSDEIAQRQEDLEDGIRKGLISLDEARKELRKLVRTINLSFETKKSLNKKIAQAKSPEKIGELIIYFYSNLLKESTKYNFDLFASDSKKQAKRINIYCLLHLLMQMSNDENKKRRWILRELRAISLDNNKGIKLNSELFNKLFSVKINKSSFFFIVYDYLDSLPKKKSFFEKDSNFQTEKINHKIFIECIKCLGLSENLKFKLYQKARKQKDYYAQGKAYLGMIDIIRKHLKKYSRVYQDFFIDERKKDKWKIEYLSLPQFYVLYLIFTKYMQKSCKISCVKDLTILNDNDYMGDRLYDPAVYFDIWKTINKNEANRVLAHIVDFAKDDAFRDKNHSALNYFKTKTGKMILKSEIVEKNDGKATFILKRLFKAYIDDAHQLPDEGLKNILFLFKENRYEFIEDEQIKLESILQKLRKTLPDDEYTTNMIINNIKKKKDFHKIRSDTIKKLKDNPNISNEVKAFLVSREKLYDFIKKYILKDTHFNRSHKNEFLKSYPRQQAVLKEFRRVMNNPILNATPLWKRILTRGICDYIASLTDQEAIDEYEKLYAGVMELV